MNEKEIDNKQTQHKKLAKSLFNQVWDLLEKEKRTEEEDDKMVHAAHASRYHWGEIGTPITFERGEWQISRVYSTLNRPESAIFHAQRCLDICLKNGIEDFDIAFAYEALARAYAVNGDKNNHKIFFKLGEQAAKNIKKEDDREYFITELHNISNM
jgi:hypothetical protein